MLLCGYDGADFCVLDPSYTPTKFERPDRAGRVNTTHAPYLYCNADTLHGETEDSFTKYHLFSRKK